MTKIIKLGSRTSKLAVVQTEIVAAKLKEQFPDYEFKIVTKETLGDEVQNKALYAFGGKALWTSELEELLARPDDSGVDMIVHSLKGMLTSHGHAILLTNRCPDQPSRRICPRRYNRASRDAVVMRSDLPYSTLAELPAGSIVGTSSVRRVAQLRRNYPHLETKIARGNLNTRIAKLENRELQYSCLILAAAGLERLDFGGKITQYLSSPDVLYAVGQGALGVEIRKGDSFVQGLVDKIVHVPTLLTCTAERSLMHKLEGGCSVPLAVWSSMSEDGTLTMEASIINVDGSETVASKATAPVTTKAEAEQFGMDLAEALLANGAGKILEKINYERMNQKD